MHDIGKWLKINGESIYDSKLWRFAEEGPTTESDGQFNDSGESVYTSQDFRFTVNHGYLYATCLKYPENGHIEIKSLRDTPNPYQPFFHGQVDDVSILGFDEKIDWIKDKDSLRFTTTTVKSNFPVVIKIKLT